MTHPSVKLAFQRQKKCLSYIPGTTMSGKRKRSNESIDIDLCSPKISLLLML